MFIFPSDVFPTCSYISYSNLNLVCWSGLALAINSEKDDLANQICLNIYLEILSVLLETYAVLLPFVRLKTQKKDGMKAMGTEILLLF